VRRKGSSEEVKMKKDGRENLGGGRRPSNLLLSFNGPLGPKNGGGRENKRREGELSMSRKGPTISGTGLP